MTLTIVTDPTSEVELRLIDNDKEVDVTFSLDAVQVKGVIFALEAEQRGVKAEVVLRNVSNIT